MNRNLIFILCALWIMLAGCEIFPYVMEPDIPTTPSQTETPIQPTQTQPVPTATLEMAPTITTTPFEPIPTTTIAVEGDLPVQTLTYAVQDDNPIYLSNFSHPDSGCDWMGIAGQVFNAEGIEVKGLVIVVGDEQAGDEYQWSAQTGQALFYGPGGYEVQFSDTPQETIERFWVQVLDQDGIQLSEQYFFDTKTDCSEILVLMNFVVIEGSQEKAMPTPTLEAYP